MLEQDSGGVRVRFIGGIGVRLSRCWGRTEVRLGVGLGVNIWAGLRRF